MECGTLHLLSPACARTESECVGLCADRCCERPGAQPPHPAQLHFHWCSKCFLKTGVYLVRVDHVGWLHSVTLCVLL